MTLAIIPARGGSKRIPRKNIKLFNGRPAISYAIEAAKKTNLFNQILVSTEDTEIAEIAKLNGAEVPIMRPLELSGDHITTTDVMHWAVNAYKSIGIQADYACCIYPVNPLMLPEDLVLAFKMSQDARAHYCFPVAPFPSKIERALKIDSNYSLSSVNRDFEFMRSQDIEPKYFDAGQFYWGKCSAWQSKLSIHNNSIGLILPAWRSIDIDDEADWKRAEIAYQFLLKEKNESV
jgi:pseudaminic acid cytidylyltransferase